MPGSTTTEACIFAEVIVRPFFALFFFFFFFFLWVSATRCWFGQTGDHVVGPVREGEESGRTAGSMQARFRGRRGRVR